MKIVVCVKQVPDTDEVRIDPSTGTLIRDGVESVVNPDDAAALEIALSIKDAHADAEVSVVSMGPPQAEDALRECLAMGADSAVLLSDRAFSGADTWATSTVLAAALRKLGAVDLVLAGRQATDGDTAQVGPELAEKLGLPQITYALDLEVADGMVRATREWEDGDEVVEARMPALVTVLGDAVRPRYMTLRGIARSARKDVRVWNLADLGLDAAEAGLPGSPTRVVRTFAPASKGGGVLLSGTPKDAAIQLVAELRKRQAIRADRSEA